jgi:hypothetical protein
MDRSTLDRCWALYEAIAATPTVWRFQPDGPEQVWFGASQDLGEA